MAITITQPLTNTLLTADTPTPANKTFRFRSGYNKNVIKWWHDTAKTVVSGEIWFTVTGIGTFKFQDLVPLGTAFQFDCQQVIKMLFGQFKDDKQYVLSDYAIHDGSLSLYAQVTLKVLYSDDTEDSNPNVFTYWNRAVMQHTDKLGTLQAFYEPSTLFNSAEVGVAQVLMRGGDTTIKPNLARYLFTQKIRVFKGYPMDFAVIAEPTNNKLIYTVEELNGDPYGTDEYSGSTTYYTNNEWIRRIILSDGQNLLPVLDYPNLKAGKLTLELNTTLEEPEAGPSEYGILYDIVDECGIYLKWLNARGGWSYWLFNRRNRQQFTTKTRGTILNNNTLSYDTDEIALGVDAEEKLQLYTQHLERWALNQLLDIATSPAVFIYTLDKGTQTYANGTEHVWLRVPQVNNFKYTIKSETDLYQVGFEFDLPRLFTQTL